MDGCCPIVTSLAGMKAGIVVLHCSTRRVDTYLIVTCVSLHFEHRRVFSLTLRVLLITIANLVISAVFSTCSSSNANVVPLGKSHGSLFHENKGNVVFSLTSPIVLRSNDCFDQDSDASHCK